MLCKHLKNTHSNFHHSHTIYQLSNSFQNKTFAQQILISFDCKLTYELHQLHMEAIISKQPLIKNYKCLVLRSNMGHYIWVLSTHKVNGTVINYKSNKKIDNRIICTNCTNIKLNHCKYLKNIYSYFNIVYK